MRKFHGTGTALVTPFDRQGEIDYTALRKLIRLQLEGKVDFLVVQGTTGESPTLDQKEKMQVLETVLEENAGQLPVVYGLGGNNTRQISAMMREFEGKVDGLLSVSPYYNKPTQAGIVQHYTQLAEATDLPIILYNVPGRTGSNVSAETTLKLAEIKNIVAMKEASGDFDQIMEIIRCKPEGFSLLSGDDAITLPMIASGAEGVISVVSNALPEKFAKMVREALAGNLGEARKIHYELLPITRLFFAEGNPGGVKIGLSARKIMEGNLRLPLFPVSEELSSRINEEMFRLLE
ncbi:MAG: 4-hydroxy-tetrahydrodipicolinate synthase [Bacteroidetes bacterium]|nr:MAG: 4-hydroxy-tetrahydrodipicolinate synthase [Bacteroidota bacterium]